MKLTLNILPDEPKAPQPRKPSWLKMKMPAGDEYFKLLKLVNDQNLHTVCQSAKCPNMGECWAAGTATLMILGDVCTRSCGFCHIATGRPPTLDLEDEAAAAVGMDGVVQAVSAWLAVVEAACGRRCILYTGKYWANSYLSDDFSGHPLWLASYNPEPHMPTGWQTWAIWQYSETGTVPGVPNPDNTDLNYFNGDENKLRRWAATGVLD